MTGMDGDSVTLSLKGRAQKIGLGTLASRFDGGYVTFWSMPSLFREQINAGERGPEVEWIAARLAQANGQPVPRAKRTLDLALQEQLRVFQAQHNLKADGVAGPRTYMRLNQLTGVAEPRLLTASATGNK